MELGPEVVSLLEKCPHFRGCYVQISMELGLEDMSLIFQGVLIREVPQYTVYRTYQLTSVHTES